MSYRVGDALLRINIKEMPQSGFHDFFQKMLATHKEGDTLKVGKMRDGKEIELSPVVEKVRLTRPAELTEDPGATKGPLAFREQWQKARAGKIRLCQTNQNRRHRG